MKRLINTELIIWKNEKNRKPLILKGARQTGKTYLLKHFGESEFRKTHYLNLLNNSNLNEIFNEAKDISGLIDDLNYKLSESIDINHDLLIIDEIQENPKALSMLKVFHEELPKLAVACAGSHMGLLFSEESFPVGKVSFLNLFPMNFEEFLLSNNDSQLLKKYRHIKSKNEISSQYHHALLTEFKKYLFIGGLPAIVNLYHDFKTNKLSKEQVKLIRKEQNHLLESYISDFTKHSGKINANHIHSVFKSIPRNIAQSQNLGLKKYIFKDIIKGRKGYQAFAGPIHWLIHSGLVILVSIVNKAESPLLAYTKENRFKLYFFDIGLLGTFLELDYEEIMKYDFGINKGAFTENFVAQELLSLGHKNIYSWEENNSEIEFLLKEKGELIPLEVKASHRYRARSFEFYSKRYHPERAFIISTNKADFSNKKVLKLPVYCPVIQED